MMADEERLHRIDRHTRFRQLSRSAITDIDQNGLVAGTEKVRRLRPRGIRDRSRIGAERGPGRVRSCWRLGSGRRRDNGFGRQRCGRQYERCAKKDRVFHGYGDIPFNAEFAQRLGWSFACRSLVKLQRKRRRCWGVTRRRLPSSQLPGAALKSIDCRATPHAGRGGRASGSHHRDRPPVHPRVARC